MKNPGQYGSSMRFIFLLVVNHPLCETSCIEDPSSSALNPNELPVRFSQRSKGGRNTRVTILGDFEMGIGPPINAVTLIKRSSCCILKLGRPGMPVCFERIIRAHLL